MSSTSDPTLAAVFRRTLTMYHSPGVRQGVRQGVPTRTVGDSAPGTNLNSWDWGPGIAVYALQKSYPFVESDLQQAYFDFFRGWFAHFLDRTPPTPAINSAILLNVLWLAVHDPALPFSSAEQTLYKNYCLERVAYYRQHALKLPSGVYSHTVATGSPASRSQVWADNLFMLVLLLAQVAVTEGDRLLFGQMTDQLELHYQVLSDPATGLLYHGWQETPGDPAGSHLNGALWGRGNGWAALGAAFLKGVRLGWLSTKFQESGQRGLAAVRASISPGGDVLGVSGSTPLLHSLADYETVPHDRTLTWGQGLALLALVEGNLAL